MDISDVTPVFRKGIFLADHLFCAMSGKERQEKQLPTEQSLGWGYWKEEAEGAAL